MISKHDYVSSIVISDYKWPSNPLPCGVFMTKTGILMNPAVFSEPFKPKASGSCNGLLTLALWMLISTHSYDKYVKMIARCLQLARYVVERLKELEKEASTELWIHHSTLSLAVMFRKPNDELVYKYGLCWRFQESKCFIKNYLKSQQLLSKLDFS